ncbi:MAG: YfaZ family outer membrane protein [Thermodesulfobacteriota bacterium]|nr:YfaZ family outer membrane protein [Thermodesulfobacteriota bacterium]
MKELHKRDKRMHRCFAFVFFILLCTVNAHAQSISVDINEESAQLMFKSIFSEESFGDTELNARVLYTSDDLVYSLGADILGEPGGMSGLEVGVGGKLYGANTKDNDVFFIGFGALFRYAPFELDGLFFSGLLSYAPRVLSFFDAERLLEADLKIAYELVPRGTVYIGYRNLWIDIEEIEKVRIEEGIFAGLEYRF